MLKIVRQAFLLTVVSVSALASASDSRTFEFTYEVLAGEFPGTEAVDIYIPLPAEHSGQQVLQRSLDSSPPGQGWIPIDASEAAKHPQRRELFYGTHPADRIHFSTGRDLVLSQGSSAMPLNYFIYPYVEVGGKPWQVKLQTRFAYREVTTH